MNRRNWLKSLLLAPFAMEGAIWAKDVHLQAPKMALDAPNKSWTIGTDNKVTFTYHEGAHSFKTSSGIVLVTNNSGHIIEKGQPVNYTRWL